MVDDSIAIAALVTTIGAVGAQVGADVTTNIPTAGMAAVCGINNAAAANDRHVHIGDFAGYKRAV